MTTYNGAKSIFFTSIYFSSITRLLPYIVSFSRIHTNKLSRVLKLKEVTFFDM